MICPTRRVITPIPYIAAAATPRHATEHVRTPYRREKEDPYRREKEDPYRREKEDPYRREKAVILA